MNNVIFSARSDNSQPTHNKLVTKEPVAQTLTGISVTINLFYNSILRAIYMTKENADISRFSKILQPGVKVYKCKKYHYQKLTFIVLFWFLIKNRFIQKKSNARRNVSIYSWYFCYQFDNKIKRLYMFESKTRILM